MHLRSPAEVALELAQRLPVDASGDLMIAFSGGLDSTVLLHALAPLARVRRVRAVYVNHGLHPDATRWQGHCAAQAQALGVAFHARAVQVPLDAEDGLESAARRVRYEALRELLRPGETLLTAHHADDQLETVLLALLRGSGLEGLAAMPHCQRFGAGWHMRPFLDLTRDELRAWAVAQELRWLEDPSNDSVRFDRNFLRVNVIPALRVRWPAAARVAARSARHLREAVGLLNDLAAADLAAASLGPCLRVSALAALTPPRRRNVLRYWLRICGARAPGTRKLAALEHDMLAAAADRSPCVRWDEVEVRRHRDLLYCTPQLPARPRWETQDWTWRLPLQLGCAPGRLRAEIAHGSGLRLARLPSSLRVATRRGGERLRLPGHAHRRELKKLLQEANILPWWRDRLPLVFVGDTLIAVADLWVDASYAADPNEPSVEIVWEGRPQLQALESDRGAI